MSTGKDERQLPIDRLKQIARKYGVEVVDAAERGIRAIGILGGVSWKHKQPASASGSDKNNEP